MADTPDVTDVLRPLARPETLSPEPLRPRLRPDDGTRTAALEPGDIRPELRPDGLGTVPEETAANATTAEALDLDRTALIGLFQGADGRTALLRLAGGSIVRVAAGGFVDGDRVTAIGADGLRLRRNGTEVLLSMPG